MSQNCECTKPSIEIPVRGLKIALDEEALSGFGNNCNCVSYSLEEQWTGKYWVDGKKIYQKTIKHLDLPKNEIAGILHGIPKEALINEDFCLLPRKASSGRSEVYQDIHELRTGRV